MAFRDPESSINHYLFGMGDEEGKDNIYPFSYLPGTATRYLAKGTYLFTQYHKYAEIWHYFFRIIGLYEDHKLLKAFDLTY